MSQKTKWNIRNGIVTNEDDIVVAMLPSDSTEENEKVIKTALELRSAVEEFIEEIDTGSLKPKTAYDRFKKILNK